MVIGDRAERYHYIPQQLTSLVPVSATSSSGIPYLENSCLQKFISVSFLDQTTAIHDLDGLATVQVPFCCAGV